MALSAKAQRELTSQIDTLLFKRDSLYQQVDSLYTLALTLTIDSENIDQFKIRMEKLDSNYASFNKCNAEIVKLRSMLDATSKLDDLAETKKLAADMDTRYFYLLTAHRQLCPNEFLRTTRLGLDDSTARSNHDVGIKLPPIEIPHFDGSLKGWPAFKDCFISLIHENQTLSDVHKFQYLISVTKGDANALVRTLPLTDANYAIIWQKLLNRFDNKRVLAAHYLEEILNFENLNYESASKLRLLIDTLTENMSAIDRIDLPDSLANFVICHLVLKKLDKRTRQLFEEEYAKNDFPTLENLKDFLRDHCKAMEAAQPTEPNKFKSAVTKPLFSKYSLNKNQVTSNSPQVRLGQGTSKSFVSNTAAIPLACGYCSNAHVIYKCTTFNALPPLQRKEFVRSKRFCFNCLSNLHMLNQCNSNSTCRKCNQRHHTLLHIDNKPFKEQDLSGSTVSTRPTAKITTGTSNLSVGLSDSDTTNTSQLVSMTVNAVKLNRPTEKESVTLLGTLKLNIQDVTGQYKTVRALADPGSQLSFITEHCVRELGLPRQKYNMPVTGLSQTPVNTSKGIINCILKPSYDNQPNIAAKAVILEKITSPLPTRHIGPNIKNAFHHLNLADSDFDSPAPIDFLLGADLYPKVFDGGRISCPPGHPTPYHSVFGWVLIGETDVYSALHSRSTENNLGLTSHLCVLNAQSLDTQIKQFWEVEELPQTQHVSEADKFCENHFVQNHSRDSVTGRYIVKLPFREDYSELGSSFDNAFSRFRSLEKRFTSNKDLKTSYHAFMDEYESLGHMRPLQSTDVSPKYHIPHHGILKDTSSTTRFRTVFDASAVSSNGKSLNDVLYAGPKLQKDIVEIISHFRLHAIAVVADITKMYRQIWVHPDHQPFQTILWRKSLDEEIQQYVLNTVTYGVTCSPFLAMRTLHQLVQDEGKHYPLAVKPITEDMFVDDLLTGSSSLNDALLLKNDINALLNAGGFQLRKWSSNSPEFLSSISEEDRESNLTFTEPDCDATIKILGIKWCPSSDVFTYQVHATGSNPTKRNILSHIARIFDLLGWVTPVVIWAKILIQRLWLQGIGWDDEPSENIQEEWLKFIHELPVLCSVKIPRFILSDDYQQCSLHGFCDASNNAYAAVVYVRVVHGDGSISVHLFIAKSRVAPLKTLSLPKLELCGAVLLAKLLDYSNLILSDRLTLKPEIYAWCDSTITLNWIHNSPHLLKTFIANRVAIIHDKTNPNNWYHVGSGSNPADCASRGLFPSELLCHSLWWAAPDWLHKNQEYWPKQDYVQVPLTQLPEVRPTHLQCHSSSAGQHDLSILERFSNFERLKRVTSWCFRFIHNCSRRSEERILSPLTVEEVNSSLLFWIKRSQVYYFPDLIQCLKSKTPITGPLSKLDIFADSEGILRVGGRLNFCFTSSYDKKHPILLPKHCHLSALIVDYYHQLYFHVGPRTLQSILLRRFWIISNRNLIRKRLGKCVKCARFKAITPQPMMASLPAARLQRVRPFLQVGADFGGPFQTKAHRARKPLLYKSYLCLFVCLSTKAVHLETVSSLTTEDFLAAFNRFVSRRGLCTDIYTDNGTNFVGANNHLKEVYQFLQSNSNKIQSSLSLKQIKWHFNPPSSPHFGGLWEAGIKSAKYHLKRIVGEQILTFEELSTLFCQIESILNSRPLCTISTDPNEFEVLTPGHFLIGDSLVATPQQDLTPLALNRLSRWQLVQQANQHFWRRWSSEYLHTLQQRSKWTKHVPNLCVGDVVLIKDTNQPPLHWPLGIIIELHKGPDDVARVASLRTKNGQKITRPVVKLCPLPVNN